MLQWILVLASGSAARRICMHQSVASFGGDMYAYSEYTVAVFCFFGSPSDPRADVALGLLVGALRAEPGF